MSKQKRMTSDELQAYHQREREQLAKMQREDLLNAIIQAIRENPDLRRELVAALAESEDDND